MCSFQKILPPDGSVEHEEVRNYGLKSAVGKHPSCFLHTCEKEQKTRISSC